MNVPPSQVTVASRIPCLPPVWSVLCWIVFWADVLLLVGALVWWGCDRRGAAPELWAPVIVATAVAFAMAAVNTFLTAQAFDSRRRALGQILECAFTEAPKVAPSQPVYVLKNEEGELILDARSSGDVGSWRVRAQGVFQAEPYRATKSFAGAHTVESYVDLLRAEVHRARVRAGSLAGALGGLALAMFQLLRLLASTIPAE